MKCIRPMNYLSIGACVLVGAAALDTAAAQIEIRPSVAPNPKVVVESAESAPAPTAALYDLGDILEPGAGSKRIGSFDQDGAIAATAQLVRSFCRPALQAGEEVQAVGRQWLALVGRPEQHAWLEAQLAASRAALAGEAAAADWIEVRCTKYLLPDAVFVEHIQPAIEGPRPEESPADNPQGLREALPEDRDAPTIFAKGAETREFLEGIKGLDGVEHEVAVVSLAPLQLGEYSRINQIAYVRDFDIEVAKAAFVANPIVDVVKDGVSVVFCGLRLPDGAVGLSVQSVMADLQRPIPVFETELGVGVPVQIQLPRVMMSRAQASLRLPDGDTAFFVSKALNDRRALIALTVTSMEKPQPTGGGKGK